MVEVYNRNVVSNFKYTIKAVTIFMSRIVLQCLNADHNFLFRKLEKDLKYYTKSYIMKIASTEICETVSELVSYFFWSTEYFLALFYIGNFTTKCS